MDYKNFGMNLAGHGPSMKRQNGALFGAVPARNRDVVAPFPVDDACGQVRSPPGQWLCAGKTGWCGEIPKKGRTGGSARKMLDEAGANAIPRCPNHAAVFRYPIFRLQNPAGGV
jgi:hypothetical protein